ncbi:MAG: hypothetical protein V1799_17295 [bacterium]
MSGGCSQKTISRQIASGRRSRAGPNVPTTISDRERSVVRRGKLHTINQEQDCSFVIRNNQRVKNIWSLFPILTLFVSLGFWGCSEDPNPVGAGIIPLSDQLKFDTLRISPIQSGSIEVIPKWYEAARFFIGKSADVEAWSLLQFTALPESLRATRLVKASIRIVGSMHVGDSLAPFSITTHELLKSWDPNLLTLDTIQNTGFYNSAPLRNVSFGSIADTALLSIPLDTLLLRKWIGSPGDTITYNYGVLVKPSANLSVIKGFFSTINGDTATLPKLEILYQRDGATKIDTVIMNTGVQRSLAVARSFGTLTDTTKMYVYNGTATRGFVTFNVVSIPPRAYVYRALLELTLDKSKSRKNSFTIDSTFAYFSDLGGTVNESYYAPSQRNTVNGETVYSYVITPYAHRWTREPGNYKVYLAGVTEASSIDLFTFHGMTTNLALRPKLTLIYVVE